MKMISKNTKKILSYLLRNFELRNINQISKELKISVGSAFKILKDFETRKLVSLISLGNAKYHLINFDNKESVKILELILLEERNDLRGYANLYAKEFENSENSENSEIIVLFGSVLRNKKFNDVDILFVTDKVKAVLKFCLGVSRVRSKPVVPLIINRKDLIQEIKGKKESILDIIRTGVVIKGGSIFLEVMKNAHARR